MSEKKPRILLADGYPLVAAGVAKLLEDDAEVVGIARDGEELFAMAITSKPDVVVSAISMPKLDGLEATRRIVAADPGARVVILSGHDDAVHVKAAFAAGARGYVAKSGAPDELLTAVDEVLEDRYYACPAVTRYLVDVVTGRAPEESSSREVPTPLSHREQEIACLVARGWGNQRIADSVHLAEATVRSHLKRIFLKLELENRVELALYAVHTGLVH